MRFHRFVRCKSIDCKQKSDISEPCIAIIKELNSPLNENGTEAATMNSPCVRAEAAQMLAEQSRK